MLTDKIKLEDLVLSEEEYEALYREHGNKPENVFRQIEREATAKHAVKKIVEEIEKYRWQGHKPMIGFDAPKGYLLNEDFVQQLKKLTEE